MLKYGVKVGFMLLLEILSLGFIAFATNGWSLGGSWHLRMPNAGAPNENRWRQHETAPVAGFAVV